MVSKNITEFVLYAFGIYTAWWLSQRGMDFIGITIVAVAAPALTIAILIKAESTNT